MARLLSLVCAMCLQLIARAGIFTYQFSGTPVPEALRQMMYDHPDLDINFIYNELESYATSACVSTDNAYDAIRLITGQNPIAVMKVEDSYFVEALQHGKYTFRGQIAGSDHDPVPAATVMLLSPRDSTAITFGITDADGNFSIPCDHRRVIAKISNIGYTTSYHRIESFDAGTIIISEQPVRLGEVKVEAKSAVLDADRTVYTPSVRQKNAARDAWMLLSLLSMPQVDVDLQDKAVTNIQGEKVAVYIDYLPASAQDMAGLRTQDIRRVEYLIFPSDARFQGNAYVINFIMQKYEIGGYTKVSATEQTGAERSEASVYSKLTYRKMTFDLYAAVNRKACDHQGAEEKEIFRFDDFCGQDPSNVVRESETLYSMYRNNGADISLRAAYGTDKAFISNRVALSYSNTPHDDVESSVVYLPCGISTTTKTGRNTRFSSLHYYIDSYAAISGRLSFSGRAWYIYGDNTTSSSYLPAGMSRILNIAKETSHHFQLYPTLTYKPDSRNSLELVAGCVNSWNHISYRGNSASRQEYVIGAYGANVGYQHRRRLLVAGVEACAFWNYNRISGINACNRSPQVNVYANWTPHDGHQLNLAATYGHEIPEASQKSPNMLQQDELIWYSGNPYLSNYKYCNSTVTYSFFPNNRWQLTLTGRYSMLGDKIVSVYSPEAPDGMMLRRYVNDGYSHDIYLRLGLTAKFLDGRLTAKVRPQARHITSTGYYAWRHNELSCRLQLQYFFGDFYAWGWYLTPSRYQNSTTGIIRQDPQHYLLEIGWSRHGLNISASASDFFYTGWDDGQERLISPFYSFERTVYGDRGHARFAITAVYTIGYGKKIKRDDELSGSSGSPSAILK